MPPYRTFLSWSTGKDSALALNYLIRDPRFSIECLLTSINQHYRRVSMHGVRIELLLRQSYSLGIPLRFVSLSEVPSNQEYEQKLSVALTNLQTDGFTHAAYGDIFLEDLRNYREQMLSKYRIGSVFPLWKKNTRHLAFEFIHQGFRAVVVCVDATRLDNSFVGRELDMRFLEDLPPEVDPCGENGEFHTFCFDGPVFKSPIEFAVGEIVRRSYEAGNSGGFWYCDLIPENNYDPA